MSRSPADAGRSWQLVPAPASALTFALALAFGCGDGGVVDLDGGPDAAFDAEADGGPFADGSVDAPPAADAELEDAGLDAGDDAGPGSEAAYLDEVLAVLRDPGLDHATATATLLEVARERRWPLTDGVRWLFVTEDEAPEVYWVGDPNGWDEAANPAERLASGAHHLVLVELDAIPRGAKYKWFVGAHRPPHEATAFGVDEFGEHGWIAPPLGQAWLERRPGFEGPGVRTRTVRLRLPALATWSVADGTRAPEPSRVLILQDGQNVFRPGGPFGTWGVELTLDDVHQDVLAVAIDSADDRFETYTHVPDDIGGGAPIGGGADRYLDFIEADVLPYVRARYGVAAARAQVAMLGSSLGGLLSLYVAHSRPELARCVMGMSPTLRWGAFEADGSAALVNLFTTATATSVYLDSGGGVVGTCHDGDGDGVVEGDDQDNYCATIQLRDHLASIGYRFGVDLFHWHEPGALHREAAWGLRVRRALDACQSGGWGP